MAEIAAERGHTTSASENRGCLPSSNADAESHNSGSVELHAAGNTNTQTHHNQVASFALDNLSDGDSSEAELGCVAPSVSEGVASQQHGQSWSAGKVLGLAEQDDLSLEQLHVDRGAPAVGVLIDVTVHGHVNVGLIPTPELDNT